MRWIGALPLDKVHMGSLQLWIAYRRKAGVSAGTVNHGLKVIRRIANLASTEWLDENGLTWLLVSPKIKLLPDVDKRQLYPLSWDEQGTVIPRIAGASGGDSPVRRQYGIPGRPDGAFIEIRLPIRN
jgi:hypothetical protein